MRFTSIIATTLFIVICQPLRLFLIGGHSYENADLYRYLANSIPDRRPTPNQCNIDWEITKCPKIAVATSSHQT